MYPSLQSKEPMRLKVAEIHPHKKGLANNVLLGTKPQYRESSELSRLSPIMK
jgi:hypothetical protein